MTEQEIKDLLFQVVGDETTEGIAQFQLFTSEQLGIIESILAEVENTSE